MRPNHDSRSWSYLHHQQNNVIAAGIVSPLRGVNPVRVDVGENELKGLWDGIGQRDRSPHSLEARLGSHSTNGGASRRRLAVELMEMNSPKRENRVRCKPTNLRGQRFQCLFHLHPQPVRSEQKRSFSEDEAKAKPRKINSDTAISCQLSEIQSVSSAAYFQRSSPH